MNQTIKCFILKLNKHQLAHFVYSLIVLLPFFIISILTSFWIYFFPAWTVLTFYYSRELTDAQNKLKIDRYKNPFALAFTPWKWPSNSQWDYFPVLALVIVLGIIRIF